MLKRAVFFLALSVAPAMAQAVPTPEESVARDKLLIGQLYQALGQAELRIQELQKAAAKPPEVVPHEHPH